MKRYISYIIALFVVVFALATILHNLYKPQFRNVKYGNPAYEKLVRECRYYKTEDDYLTVKLYEGKNKERGTVWYSVTYERPGTEETQILISAGEPGIDSMGLCDREIKLMCGKGCINIPVENIESRFAVPIIYYNGREVQDTGILSDKI